MKSLVHFIVLVTLVLQTGFLSGISVSAQGEGTETPTPTPTAEATATAPPLTETATASPPPATETATPPPLTATETPPPSGLTLTLSANPDFLSAGGHINLHWQVDGLSQITTTMRLHIYAPAALVPQGQYQTSYVEGLLDLPLDALEGQINWKAETGLEGPLTLAAEIVDGASVLAYTEFEIKAQSEFIIGNQGGEAKGLGGRVRVVFPAGAVHQPVRVRVDTPSAESLPVKSLSGSPFELTAVAEGSASVGAKVGAPALAAVYTGGQEITQFDQVIEILVAYDEGLIDNDEEHLQVFWYDPTDGGWKPPLGQRVDTEANIIHVYTDHFTVFDTYTSNWQSSETPTMNYFSTSAFTGSSSFSMPIKVPAGPGGWQPSLTLSYTSSTIDNLTVDTAHTFFVGEGQWLVHNCAARSGMGGNPDHQATVDDLVQKAYSEFGSDITVNESKSIKSFLGNSIDRRPDVSVFDSDKNLLKIYEAARRNKTTGNWVRRELRKIEDYDLFDILYEFVEVQ